ncbi:unnamed protein product [Dracunculus medinensis]|uniref:TOG domain-containing protein n=1 Tax=Dracunculus medinensis TaxID=318479 RepID=A0A0N4UCU4_DRAME|nr:unnamed protein product [Dracunculus medinensis]
MAKKYKSSLEEVELEMRKTLKKFRSTDWTDKVAAINMILCISEISPCICEKYSNRIFDRLVEECKDIRTALSRTAIFATGQLFSNVKVCLTLLQKTGDVSHAFIRRSAYDALNEIIKNASTATMDVLAALLDVTVITSKNNAIRASCASLVVKLVKRIGPSQAIKCSEASKLLSALVAFAQDADPNARNDGRRGLFLLNQGDDGNSKGLSK